MFNIIRKNFEDKSVIIEKDNYKYYFECFKLKDLLKLIEYDRIINIEYDKNYIEIELYSIEENNIYNLSIAEKTIFIEINTNNFEWLYNHFYKKYEFQNIDKKYFLEMIEEKAGFFNAREIKKQYYNKINSEDRYRKALLNFIINKENE